MRYTFNYDSPLGGITLASDGEALSGLWFDGQKYFGSTLHGSPVTADLPVFRLSRAWLDHYFSGELPEDLPPLRPVGSVFRLVGLPAALVSTLFVNRQQHTGKLLKPYLLVSRPGPQTQRLESSPTAYFRQHGLFIYKAGFLQYIDQMLPAKLVSLEIAAHTALHGTVRICRDTFPAFEIILFVNRKRHDSDAQFHYGRLFLRRLGFIDYRPSDRACTEVESEYFLHLWYQF